MIDAGRRRGDVSTMIPFSILDLAPVTEGSDARRAFANMLDLARHAERLGYRRYWLAEHHNMPGIASAATAVVIGHVAGGHLHDPRRRGRHHAAEPRAAVIAEQFGTLASLYPGRIDLGLGRAPGTDQLTARALRRTRWRPTSSRTTSSSCCSTSSRRSRASRCGPCRARGSRSIWILGSSLFGAQLAAALGLPYAFASHFAPDRAGARRSRSTATTFRPSAQLARPYVMLALNVFAADTDAEARRLFTSLQPAS